MRKLSVIFLFILNLLIIKTGTVLSQITTTPYSIFGLGYMENNSTGPSKAMGGTSLAFLSGRYINYANPASYSGIDSLISIFEVGAFTKYTVYSTDADKQSLLNANLKYILMGFRITPWLATSFGFSPFSSVGYTINTSSPIEGTYQQYKTTYSGEGGVNQVYLGGSVKLIKNLSVGINAAYLFGNVTHTEASSTFDYTIEDITFVSNVNLNYGLNYQVNVGNWRSNLGLTYGNSRKLRTNNVTTVETTHQVETLKSRNVRYSIPQTAGAGIAVRKGYFSAGFDYEWGNWESINFDNTYLDTRNSNRYSFGVEFPSLGIRKGSGRMFLFRVGAEYRQSYMVIKSMPIDYRAITAGVGIPLKGVLSVVNASLELGQNGTTKRNLFKETFFMLNLDLSLRDVWFQKKRYD